MTKNKLSFTNKHQTALHSWFLEYHRPLPWRKDRNAYKIWISETMLQQTTTTAVIPFFERFTKVFPNLKTLAQAHESKVIEVWAGLGYYSRARNLHKAAKMFHKNGGLPKSYEELIEYPGLGPYTARSVASIAYGQSVGVLDGNVIRVLSRFFNQKLEWWKTAPRNQLQQWADLCVQNFPSHEINQALMELGATICTPTSPKCNQCPWVTSCSAYEDGSVEGLPLKKPKKDKEIWLWKARVYQKGNKIALCKNGYAPFLKKQWFLPGEVKQLSKKPTNYQFTHSITHHNIFVQVNSFRSPPSSLKKSEIQWVAPEDISQWIPASLIKKAIANAKT